MVSKHTRITTLQGICTAIIIAIYYDVTNMVASMVTKHICIQRMAILQEICTAIMIAIYNNLTDTRVLQVLGVWLQSIYTKNDDTSGNMYCYNDCCIQ